MSNVVIGKLAKYRKETLFLGQTKKESKTLEYRKEGFSNYLQHHFIDLWNMMND